MELRGQDNDMRTSSYGGHQSSPGSLERRREGSSGVTTTTTALTYTQTLDHHHVHHRRRSPNSDRPPSIASGGSHPKSTRYRECLRNHAASVGGNVFDGCGEFMPGGEEGSLEALKCAACDCHRNFHRKEVDGETTQFSPSSRRGSPLVLQLPPPLPSPNMIHHQRFFHGSPANMVQPMNVAFGGGGGNGGTESSSEDLNAYAEGGVAPPPPYVLSKKRFRTKFTQEQKDKMMEFAEKVGWRINKQDEEEVEKFCAEVGVRRQVFKVWMHNNKSLKKQPQQEMQQDQQPM